MKDIPQNMHARVPVDQTAARVIAKGTHYVANRDRASEVFHAPPPMRAVPPGAVNLTGIRVGHLRVLGLSVRKAGGPRMAKPQNRWVCRCVCGNFCERRTKVLRDPLFAQVAWCDECEHTRVLKKRGASFKPPEGAK